MRSTPTVCPRTCNGRKNARNGGYSPSWRTMSVDRRIAGRSAVDRFRRAAPLPRRPLDQRFVDRLRRRRIHSTERPDAPGASPIRSVHGAVVERERRPNHGRDRPERVLGAAVLSVSAPSAASRSISAARCARIVGFGLRAIQQLRRQHAVAEKRHEHEPVERILNRQRAVRREKEQVEATNATAASARPSGRPPRALPPWTTSRYASVTCASLRRGRTETIPPSRPPGERTRRPTRASAVVSRPSRDCRRRGPRARSRLVLESVADAGFGDDQSRPNGIRLRSSAADCACARADTAACRPTNFPTPRERAAGASACGRRA